MVFSREPLSSLNEDDLVDARMGWGWFGQLLFWTGVFFIILWFVFYSLKPIWLLRKDSNEIDMGKVVLAALIASVVLVFIIWLLRTCTIRKIN
jgi:hypothetical protein